MNCQCWIYFVFEKESEEFSYDCQFEIPDSSERQLTPDRINVTLHFTDPHWSIVSDGTGWMYILKTGDRLQNERWKVCYEAICFA